MWNSVRFIPSGSFRKVILWKHSTSTVLPYRMNLMEWTLRNEPYRMSLTEWTLRNFTWFHFVCDPLCMSIDFQLIYDLDMSYWKGNFQLHNNHSYQGKGWLRYQWKQVCKSSLGIFSTVQISWQHGIDWCSGGNLHVVCSKLFLTSESNSDLYDVNLISIKCSVPFFKRKYSAKTWMVKMMHNSILCQSAIWMWIRKKANCLNFFTKLLPPTILQ